MTEPAHSEPQVKPQEKDDNAHLQAENARLKEALQQITKTMGRGHHDPYRHAINTIEDMRDVAWAALQTSGLTSQKDEA